MSKIYPTNPFAADIDGYIARRRQLRETTEASIQKLRSSTFHAALHEEYAKDALINLALVAGQNYDEDFTDFTLDELARSVSRCRSIEQRDECFNVFLLGIIVRSGVERPSATMNCLTKGPDFHWRLPERRKELTEALVALRRLASFLKGTSRIAMAFADLLQFVSIAPRSRDRRCTIQYPLSFLIDAKMLVPEGWSRSQDADLGCFGRD